MKNCLLNKRFLFLLSFVIFCGKVMAQDQVGNFFQAAQGDAEKLGRAYLKPLFTGLGQGYNSGWINTAEVKSPGRFDIRIVGGVALVLTSDKTFDASKLNLQYAQIAGLSPTISGPKNSNSQLDIYAVNPQTGQSEQVTSVNAPPGTGVGIVPVALPQISIGLPFHTEIMVRGFPKINIGKKGSVESYGVGLLHDIKQYIPGINDAPFDLSVIAAFSHFDASYHLNVNPSANTNSVADYSTQYLKLKTNGFTAGIDASKKFSVITFHGGVHYNSYTGKFSALGTYPVASFDNNGQPTEINVTDPISITAEKGSYASADLGFRLRLAFFSLFADYTQAKYGIATAGIGFGWY